MSVLFGMITNNKRKSVRSEGVKKLCTSDLVTPAWKCHDFNYVFLVIVRSMCIFLLLQLWWTWWTDIWLWQILSPTEDVIIACLLHHPLVLNHPINYKRVMICKRLWDEDNGTNLSFQCRHVDMLNCPWISNRSWWLSQCGNYNQCVRKGMKLLKLDSIV